MKLQAGRLSNRQVKEFARVLKGGFGYFGLGRVYLVVDLPKRWQKTDRERIDAARFFPATTREQAQAELKAMDEQQRHDLATKDPDRYIELIRAAYPRPVTSR